MLPEHYWFVACSLSSGLAFEAMLRPASFRRVLVLSLIFSAVSFSATLALQHSPYAIRPWEPNLLRDVALGIWIFTATPASACFVRHRRVQEVAHRREMQCAAEPSASKG